MQNVLYLTYVKFVVRRSGESFYDRPESFFIRRKLNKFEAGNIYTPEKLSPSVEDLNLFDTGVQIWPNMVFGAHIWARGLLSLMIIHLDNAV